MRFLSLLVLAWPLAADAEPPAPPLAFEAGTVLAGGHVLAEAATLPPVPGPVTLVTREGGQLRWRLSVSDGETRLLDEHGRWAAKAEYSRRQQNGQTVCFIYQTYLSPEWLLRSADKASRPDYRPADDRIYAFREAPCP